MHTRILSSILLSTLLLAGCESATKQDTGAIMGGILGGVLGNQVGGGKGRTAAIIVGTIAGAYLGGNIGKQMDENDRYRTQRSLETTPVNQTSRWNNPDSGTAYEVTPTRTYETSSGPCREYTTNATIDGRSETVYGTACRQPDGSWQASN